MPKFGPGFLTIKFIFYPPNRLTGRFLNWSGGHYLSQFRAEQSKEFEKVLEPVIIEDLLKYPT